MYNCRARLRLFFFILWLMTAYTTLYCITGYATPDSGPGTPLSGVFPPGFLCPEDLWVRVAISRTGNTASGLDHDMVLITSESEMFLEDIRVPPHTVIRLERDGDAVRAEYAALGENVDQAGTAAQPGKASHPEDAAGTSSGNGRGAGSQAARVIGVFPNGVTIMPSGDANSTTSAGNAMKGAGNAATRGTNNASRGIVEKTSTMNCAGTIGVISIKRPKSDPFPAYRGKIEVRPSRTPGKLRIINVVGLEDYLRGVVPNEMPVTFPIEALKAQAVAARSYTLARLGKHSQDMADLCDGTHCHVYYGARSEDPRSDEAVLTTRGLFLTYQLDIAQAFYSSTAGGYTENNENVWPDPECGNFPGKPIPYLRGVPDDEGIGPLTTEEAFRRFLDERKGRFDSGSPYFRWQEEWTGSELEKVLNTTLPQYGVLRAVTPPTGPPAPDPGTLTPAASDAVSSEPVPGDNAPRAPETPACDNGSPVPKQGSMPGTSQAPFTRQTSSPGPALLGRLLDIRVLERGVSGKIMSCEVEGTEATWIIQGESNIRSVFKPVSKTSSALRSANVAFDIKRDKDGNIVRVIARGAGFGHGVGLSQWGARGMALAKYKFGDILKHYYTGARIATRPVELAVTPGGLKATYAKSSEVFSWPGGEACLVVSARTLPAPGLLTVTFNDEMKITLNLCCTSLSPLSVPVGTYLRPGLNKVTFMLSSNPGDTSQQPDTGQNMMPPLETRLPVIVRVSIQMGEPVMGDPFVTRGLS
ncbi:MAG TPA: SpoIID/LytB domain-containing protein [Firmicutes bacterium]|nr:SpoIID/LytB domain-containing protein [Bacillota bacterium]